MAEASPEELETCMEEFGTLQELLTQHDFYMIDSRVEEMGRALGLADIGLDRDVTELSGGQRTKVLLGRLLLEKPDILLLDEPTNHLDVDAKEELRRALSAHKGSILMVCHEPEFYEGLATDVWDCTRWTTRII